MLERRHPGVTACECLVDQVTLGCRLTLGATIEQPSLNELSCHARMASLDAVRDSPLPLESERGCLSNRRNQFVVALMEMAGEPASRERPTRLEVRVLPRAPLQGCLIVQSRERFCCDAGKRFPHDLSLRIRVFEPQCPESLPRYTPATSRKRTP